MTKSNQIKTVEEYYWDTVMSLTKGSVDAHPDFVAKLERVNMNRRYENSGMVKTKGSSSAGTESISAKDDQNE
jgi:hypothetical protein